MMTHQKIADFIIDVACAGIYQTNRLGGFVVEYKWELHAWTLTDELLDRESLHRLRHYTHAKVYEGEQ